MSFFVVVSIFASTTTRRRTRTMNRQKDESVSCVFPTGRGRNDILTYARILPLKHFTGHGEL